jgi:predicted DsbA family dithiol-disulfide isomerase
MAAVGTRSMVVYGDLNCPFCYVLEERLVARDVVHQIEWRLVEHAPELPVELGGVSGAQLEELGRELEALVERAPDVKLGRPAFRPNSGRAIRAMAEACSIDPPRAWSLRLLLFRALWRHGRNIADPGVVEALVERAGLPPLRDTPEAAEMARRWTREWRDAKYERIPVMISDVDTELLGLAPVQRLEQFLASGLFSSTSELVCEVDDPRR